MRTPTILVLTGALALVGGLLVRAPSPAHEIRIAQATGPPAAELVARGRALFSDPALSAES
jgi:hypothetical protein